MNSVDRIQRYVRRILFLQVAAAAVMLAGSAVSIAAEADLEKDLQASLEKSRLTASAAAQKLALGKDISPEIGQLKALTDSVRVTNLLLEERFRLREEKVKTLGSSALSRQQAMAEGYRKALTEYLNIIDGLALDSSQYTVDSNQEKIKKLKTLLDSLLQKKKRPIIGSLPYKHLNLPAIEPTSAPAIIPAYKGGNKNVSPDDTSTTPEAPISKEIASLAQSLNWNPVSIYEYVKNTVETEWYWGCMKGAEETLHQKSGNDCDQAALLTALLRASTYPTRYVRGVIEFFPDIERAKNLIGIDDPAKIAEFFQKAGIPYKPVIAGGRIANFQIEHIWVETQVPYSNYRGVVIDEHGKTWLGLDTSIKTEDYVYNNAKDIFEQSGIGDLLSGIRDEYLVAIQTQTPLEYLQSRINAELTTQNSPLTYNDLLRTKTLTPEPMKFLPASLQFKLIKSTNEFTKIPDELIHTAKFTASDTNKNELFTVTLPLYKLSSRQVAISYEPETVQDQEIIDSYGGLDNTPSYLVRLRPVLTINKERIVVAQDGLPMGADYDLSIELISPNAAEKISNTFIAGNLTVIGIAAQKAAVNQQQDQNAQKDAERLLYEAAMHYADRWNSAEEELASLLHVSITRPIPTVVTIGGVIDVSYLLDIPHGFTWKGVYVDANLRMIETVRSSGSGVGSEGEREKMFMQLSSLQGSILENRIFEDDFQVQSISTAKLMTVANGSHVPILAIDKTNIDSILPALPFDQSIKDDIVNSVNQNLSVRIPSQELSYENWKGIGFIKENQATGESGWMLSGMIAGGMTVWSDDRWPQYYLDTLSNPYSEPANYDPASAKYIQKVASSDLKQGMAGDQISAPLLVKVMDQAQHPVANVNVTFTVKAGGGTFSNGATTLNVQTNTQGLASANIVLGKKVKDNPVYWWYDDLQTSPYPDQVGENLVDAYIASTGTAIATPFAAYGFPRKDKPFRIKELAGNGLGDTILFYSGFISLIAEDEYGNSKANVPLQLKIKDAVIDQNPPNCGNQAYAQSDKKAYFIRFSEPCIFQAPVWGACGSTSEQEIALRTTHLGSQMGVILGGTPDAKYEIETACKPGTDCQYYKWNCPSGQPCGYQLVSQPTLTFAHYTAYSCGEASLHLRAVYIADTENYLVSAQKVVDPPAAPLTYQAMAKLYAITNGDIVTSLESPSVTFDGVAGTSAQGDGFYTANVPITKVGLNWIKIEGKATIDGTEKNAGTISSPVYGVKIAMDPVPVIVTDEQGYAVQDTEIKYTILPAAPDPNPYWAASAAVHIYKSDNSGDVLIEAIRTEPTGTGKATIGRGFKFEEGKTYKVQVVLNYGGKAEMRSDKIMLKTIMFKIVKPSVDEKILIINDANGNPMMKPLTAQVELKGTGISQTLIDSQQVNWKFSVEYLVDTISAKRARKGFDPSGVGQGKDGYRIPDPNNPNTLGTEYLQRQGSTFEIDDVGNQGAKWDANFGGGIFTITAKTTIDGIEVSDTIVRKIEGQRFSEDSSFKNKVINYLNNPVADSVDPTVRSQVGSNNFFRVIATKETGRCEHFYASIYGRPKTAIYPVENGGGDGGYGLMQLTQWSESGYPPYEYPKYRQIWHWKENIDQAVGVIKIKLRKSIDLHDSHPVADAEKAEFLRWDVYQQYNSGEHFWKWEHDKKQKIDLWRECDCKSEYASEAMNIESNESLLCP